MKDDPIDLLDKGETLDISANTLVALWLKEKAKQDPIAFCRLAGENEKRFERIYGEPDKAKTKEGRVRVWVLPDFGVPFFLISSEKGSRYKINYPGGEKAFSIDRKMGSAITAFLERLIADLAGYGQK